MVSPITPPPGSDPTQVVSNAVNQASTASNNAVQAAAPTIMTYVGKYWYVWVGLVAALVLGGLQAKGLL
jgi:hypothetical protein